MGRTYRDRQDKFEKANKRFAQAQFERIQKAFEEHNEDFEEVPAYRDRNDNRSSDYRLSD